MTRSIDPTPPALDASEDVGVNRSTAPSLGDVLARRFARRSFLHGPLAIAGSLAIAGPAALAPRGARADRAGLAFAEIAHGVDERHHVAPGHHAEVLLRWGDPVLPGAPAFEPRALDAAAQAMQFGYNNDFIGYFPLPWGSGTSTRGLLCVNHEYTNAELMFPGLAARPSARNGYAGIDAQRTAVEMAAHGASIVEVARDAGGRWRVVPASPWARRITATTPIRVSGPAAGHARLRTPEDPTGTRVHGTLNNCAGGVTPWGTYLMAEENFNGYFGGALAEGPERENHRRYGVPAGWYGWFRFHPRFDASKTPNEPNRFGWVVEVDPQDPLAPPVKRTALGRFKHEGAESIVNGDGRVVIYMGDDERFDYLYRFVTHGRLDPVNRQANFTLLDAGTLFVARFEADGMLRWIPLVWGTGALIPDNGFASQADVLIETRRAADLLGATPMDRPEDVQPNPRTGRVYVLLTNNTRRTAEQVDGPNPRAGNAFGHVLELIPPGGDHAALHCRWELLVQCGDPAVAEVGATWNPATSANGWFASPDNAATDADGNLWVSTDQGRAWPKSGTADGLWSLATEGDARGTGRMFFRVPVGAELCGPKFTPDGETLFLAVQHPASDGTEHWPPFARRSTFDDPATRWPDFDPALPPRPSVVVITRSGGGRIGT